MKTLVPDPNETRIYTIGAINGRDDLLVKMIAEIEQCNLLASNDKIVFLGNFVGKEGSSRTVIDLLKQYQRLRPMHVQILRGASEHKMAQSRINFMRSDLGKEILRSYKTTHMLFPNSETNKLDVKQFMEDTVWIESLPTYYESDKYFFVHSGVNPDKDLDKQSLGGFMFIQEPFYKSVRLFAKKIVHTYAGDRLCVKMNRLGIGHDTPKKLSCVVLCDKKPANKVEVFGKVIEELMIVSKD
jgi:serine/threonine protein phosphatase 1